MGSINTAVLHKVTDAEVLVRAMAWGTSHDAAAPHGCTCNTASTAAMETAIKHTQLAKSNLSTAICTASNHCNQIFIETWKVRLEGSSRGPSPFPAPG